MRSLPGSFSSVEETDIKQIKGKIANADGYHKENRGLRHGELMGVKTSLKDGR